MLAQHAVARPAARGKAGPVDDSLAAAEGRYRARLEALLAGSKQVGLAEVEVVVEGLTHEQQKQRWRQEGDDMHRVRSTLATAMKTAMVEPPWPLVCSQPGASSAKYAALGHELQLLVAGVAVLDSACEGESELLHGSEEVAAAVKRALGGALALAAAACARAAEALAHMPPGGPCAGGRRGMGGRHAARLVGPLSPAPPHECLIRQHCPWLLPTHALRGLLCRPGPALAAAAGRHVGGCAS